MIYTLSLHDALPICASQAGVTSVISGNGGNGVTRYADIISKGGSGVRFYKPTDTRILGRYLNNRNRSEEHTSELQSRFDLVCRLLLEKKNIDIIVDV